MGQFRKNQFLILTIIYKMYKNKIMNIKFSHNYKKLEVLGNQDKARLIECLVVELEQLHKSFLDYDTDNGVYKLPKKGLFLLLIFQSVGGLFTTIRRHKKEKEKYYINARGKIFNIIITQ